MVMDGDVTWGGDHTVQCTRDVFWNGLETLTFKDVENITPIYPLSCISMLTGLSPTSVPLPWTVS